MTLSNSSILIVCNQTILADSISTSFEADHPKILQTANFLTANLSNDLATAPDIIIYVCAANNYNNACRDALNVQAFEDSCWIVLADGDDCPVLNELRSRNFRISLAPCSITATDLVSFTKLVASGHMVSVDVEAIAANQFSRARLLSAHLEPQQWQLLYYLMEGLANKEIALKDDVTEAIVKVRIRALLSKLELNNRTQAAVMAARAGICLAQHSRPKSPPRSCILIDRRDRARVAVSA